MLREQINLQAWTTPYRRYLALRQDEDFAATLAIAPAEVAEFLTLSYEGDIGAANRLIAALCRRLASSRDESLTIELSYLDIYARLCQTFLDYPLHEQNDALEIGVRGCEDAMQVAHLLEDLPCAAFYARVMASGLQGRGLSERACEAYRAALAIYRELAQSAPDVYRPNLAMTLTNLGIILRALRALEEARAMYTESLRIWRELAHTRPDVHGPDVAMTLTNLGTVMSDLRDLEDGRTIYMEALLIYRELALSAPDVYRPNLAATLNNLGNILRDLRTLEDARSTYTEALVIYRELAQSRPDAYRPNLASTLNNLSNIFGDLLALEDARSTCNEALLIYRELARSRPDVYRPDVARTLNNLGNALSDLRVLEDARAAYTEALLIRRELAQSRPDVYRPDVAKTLNDLGNILSDLRVLEDARAAYTEALLIYRELAQSRPEVYRPDVAMTLNNLGNVLRDSRAFEDARATCAEALPIWRELARSRPEIYRPNVAMTLTNLGNVLSDLHALEDGRAAYTEALLIYRGLALVRPDVFRPDVAMALTNLGTVLSDLRALEDARVAHTEALLIWRELAQSRPDVYLPKVATTLTNLGTVLRALRVFEDARATYREALMIRRDLAQSYPNVYRPEVAMTLNCLGTVLRALRAIEDARDCFQNALDLCLGTERGQELWIDASLPCANLCRLARDEAHDDEARQRAEQALDYLENGLGQLTSPEHNDKFKARIEDLALILVEQYGSEPPSAGTSGKLLRLFEWLRRAESIAQLTREKPSALPPTSLSHPILWTQRVQDRLIFGVLLPGEQLRVLQSEKIEDQLWRRQMETTRNALAEGDPGKITRTAQRLFSSFPEEVRNLLLENSPDAIFVSPCRETLALPLELIPAPDVNNGLLFAGLRRLAVRFHSLADLDAVLKETARPHGSHAVIVGDPTAGTAHALKYAQAGAEYVAGLLKTKAMMGPEATRACVLPAISGPNLGTLVFSGHGAAGGLLMAEGKFIGFRDFGAIRWINAPFIHLDCCYAGTVVGAGGGRFLGMPSVMLACGAGAVLASFHPLYDKQAMLFSNSLYEAMIGGQPLGEALMAVRRKMHVECGGTPRYWATSVLWGNPEIRMRAQ